MKLTEKQKRFADNYIELGNIEQAALKAGYSKNYSRAQSHKLLANVGVKAYLEKRMKKLDQEKIMSQQEALELLTNIANGSLRDSVVVSGGWGYEVIEKAPDLNTRKDAAKEILKRYPMNRHDELKSKMLETQIRKLEKELDTDSTTEDKLQEYFNKLDGAFNE